MIVSDPIADMLTRIRNAGQIHHDTVAMPLSKMRVSIANILKSEGYINDFRVREQSDAEKAKITLGGQELLELDLKYTEQRSRAISGLKRVSKPGLRVYAKAGELPRVMGGLGIAILSTSRGIMTDKEARRQKVGGEILCYVW